MEKNLLQLGDAGIELALLVFGLVILAVFGQVAEAAGLFNQFRNFIRAGRFAVVELFFQLIIPSLAHFEFFHHAATSFPMNLRLCRLIYR